jgi:hypothetical protein
VKGVLQFGIRAKVSTLSLDGPVEWSLDRECEEKLCLRDQFRTLVWSGVSRSYLTVPISSGGIAVCETAAGVVYGHRKRGLHTNSAWSLRICSGGKVNPRDRQIWEVCTGFKSLWSCTGVWKSRYAKFRISQDRTSERTRGGRSAFR